jgi:hypothetical protein
MHSDAGDTTQLVPGYPIRTPWDHSSVDSSPRPIAASHVLHRLLVPRHPPFALTNLTTKMLASTIQFSTNNPTPSTTTPQAPTQAPYAAARQARNPRQQPHQTQACSLRTQQDAHHHQPNNHPPFHTHPHQGGHAVLGHAAIRPVTTPVSPPPRAPPRNPRPWQAPWTTPQKNGRDAP